MLHTLLLLACTEYGVNGKGDNPAGTFDNGNPATSPIPDSGDTAVEEECNGGDDDGDGLIDEDFPDSDGDGIADCLEQDCKVTSTAADKVDILEACTGTGSSGTVTDPWNVTIEWDYTVASGSGVIVMPAIGNLTDDNGDGRIDENDVPDIAFSTWTSNTLVALNGDGSGEIFEISGFDGQGGVTIADVDADGDPEVIAIQTGYKIAAVDNTGNIKWSSQAFPMMQYPQPTVADLDEDGLPEVIADVGLVNGEDGSTIATLASPTNSWRTPIAADLDQDGEQEIILANNVYDSNGTKKWSNAGSGAGNFSAVLDADGDAGGEIFFLSGSTAYLHDEDGTLIRSFAIPGTNPGPPCVADFDGDGDPELATPANTQISVFELDGTKDWTMPMQDGSGLAGCSGYDVDGDGAYEVLFADEISFKIFDGRTGAVNYVNTNHASGTVWEYPVTADVDNDGSAEVVIANNGGGAWRGITVFGHDGSGWPKSGTTWGTHDFAVTNLNPDGSVPVVPEPSWTKYNVFRARPSVDDPSSADLGVEMVDLCVGTCAGGPVRISYRVYNQGGADVEAGTPLTLYQIIAGVEVPYQTVILDAIPMGAMLPSAEFVIENPADMGDGGFAIRVDDDGTGASFNHECDETNNAYIRLDPVCH